MAKGFPGWQVTSVTALAVMLFSGCTDEEIVYRDPVNPPPDANSGFLGYFTTSDKETTCGNCHSGHQRAWVNTGHADAYATLINSGTSQSFCESCHTISDKGNAAAAPAGWDAVKDTAYHDVQCESCHGPGNTHVQEPDAPPGAGNPPLAHVSVLGDSATMAQSCADCHSGFHHPFVEEWSASAHAVSLQEDDGTFVNDVSPSCGSCHEGRKALAAWGVTANYAEKNLAGTENYLGITCAVCHDPHGYTTGSDGLPVAGQLRYPIDVADVNQNLCMKCHQRRAEPDSTSSRGPHSPQGPMLLGDAGYKPARFDPDVQAVASTHGSERNPRLCAGCHVNSFSVNDPESGDLVFQSVGHLFLPIPCLDGQGIPTNDRACAYDVMARTWGSCTTSGCHGDASAAAAAFTLSSQRMDQLTQQIWNDTNQNDTLEAAPTDGGYLSDFTLIPPTEYVTTDNHVTPAEGALFNVRMLEPGPRPLGGGVDGSSGVHNPFLAEALLRANIDELQATYPGLPPAAPAVQDIMKGPLGAITKRPLTPALDFAAHFVALAFVRYMAPVHLVESLGTGASLVQTRQLPQDSIVRIWDSLSGRFVDSVVVRSPLPDPLVPIVQWIFQRPSWVMIGGIVLAAIVVLVIVVALWRRRRAIWIWLVTRDRGVKLALGGAVGAILLLVIAGGVKANDYIMHDNDFCRGCHIFVPSGQIFVRPDTGTYLLVNQLEGKHDTLSCHACHPFELAAQTKELYYWIMARPDKIPPHAKVLRTICEQCHVQGEAKKTWQRVASTAGHRIHLESDSAPLKDVQCLTCHARSAHRFQPADTTCAQKGCHLTDDVKIRLGRMAARFHDRPTQPLPNEEQLYCNSCHQFTAEAQLVSLDSATGTLRPREQQCFACHEMRQLLATFDPAEDPHSGSCGMCHDPHTDVKPKDALKSCADANCHATWRSVPFHVGAAHRKVAQRCETCHQPHAARVDASDCTGCHTEIRKGGGRMRPPLPFDTTKALQQSRRIVEPGRSRGQGDAPPSLPSDTFSHERHRRLACITCHSTSSRRSDLTFEPPRGCQICHHQRPARSDCADCHRDEELSPARPVSVVVGVPKQPPRSRPVVFDHSEHSRVQCVQCHTVPVSLDAEPKVEACVACHDDHHAVDRDCAACHQNPEINPAHARPVEGHLGCDNCHAPETVAALIPTRSFCLTCHSSSVDHYPAKQCTECHFLEPPEAYRHHLRKTGRES